MQTKADIETIWKRDSHVEAVMGADKVVRANIAWHRTLRHDFRFEVGVLIPSSGPLLKLRGFRGKRNYSFTLLYQNKPFRMYASHNHAPHPNPDGQMLRKPHKHVWDRDYHDRLAYVPDDVVNGDINRELAGFLRECGIQLTGALEAFLL